MFVFPTFPSPPSLSVTEEDNWTVSPQFNDALVIAMREHSKAGVLIPPLPPLLRLSPLSSKQGADGGDPTRVTMKTRVAVRDQTPHRFQVVPLRDAGKHNLLPVQDEAPPLVSWRDHTPIGNIYHTTSRTNISGPKPGGRTIDGQGHGRGLSGKPTKLHSTLGHSDPAVSDENLLPISATKLGDIAKARPLEATNYIVTSEHPSFHFEYTSSSDPSPSSHVSLHIPISGSPAEHTTYPNDPLHYPIVGASVSHHSDSHNSSKIQKYDVDPNYHTHFKSPSLGSVHLLTSASISSTSISSAFSKERKHGHEHATLPGINCRKRTNTLTAASRRSFDINEASWTESRDMYKPMKCDPTKRHAIYTQSHYVPFTERAGTKVHIVGENTLGSDNIDCCSNLHSTLNDESDPPSLWNDARKEIDPGHQDIIEHSVPSKSTLGITNLKIHLKSDFPLSTISSHNSQQALISPSQLHLVSLMHSGRIMKRHDDRANLDGIFVHPIVMELMTAVDLAIEEWAIIWE